ncbi:MAG: hypothetical protein AAF125_01650 [Chloroflexota bacterium]
MYRKGFILLLCLSAVWGVSAQSYWTTPVTCDRDFTDFQPSIEAAGWAYDDLVRFRWSPNCRYFSARLPTQHGQIGRTFVWDVTENRQIGELSHFAVDGQTTGTAWDASGDYLVVPGSGTYLWYVPDNRLMRLNNFRCGLLNATWDYENRRIYATAPKSLGGWCSANIHVGGLRVYDLDTGDTLFEYPVESYKLNYTITEDDRYILLVGYTGRFSPLRIIDRASGQQLAAVMAHRPSELPPCFCQIAISPDQQLLASGKRSLRIWDLNSPPEDIYVYQPDRIITEVDGRIRSLQFLDNETVESITDHQTARWNARTGVALP